jgi:hypothetical protein
MRSVPRNTRKLIEQANPEALKSLMCDSNIETFKAGHDLMADYKPWYSKLRQIKLSNMWPAVLPLPKKMSEPLSLAATDTQIKPKSNTFFAKTKKKFW